MQVIPSLVDHTKHTWRCRGSNPGPFTCKANALPLSYIPNSLKLGVNNLLVHTQKYNSIYLVSQWHSIHWLQLCTGSVAERSKALVLGTSLFGGVGSNPTAATGFELLWLTDTWKITPIYGFSHFQQLKLSLHTHIVGRWTYQSVFSFFSDMICTFCNLYVSNIALSSRCSQKPEQSLTPVL